MQEVERAIKDGTEAYAGVYGEEMNILKQKDMQGSFSNPTNLKRIFFN